MLSIKCAIMCQYTTSVWDAEPSLDTKYYSNQTHIFYPLKEAVRSSNHIKQVTHMW